MTRSLRTKPHDYLRKSLIEARRHAELTQVELAQRLGRAQSFVSKYETAERRLDVAEFVEVANVLRVDAAAIVAEMQRMTRKSRARGRPRRR